MSGRQRGFNDGIDSRIASGRLLTTVLSFALLSCGTDPTAPTSTPTDAGNDTATSDTGTSDASGQEDVKESGDEAGVNPCIEAEKMTGSDYAHGTINPSIAERDHYRLELIEGQLIKLRTSSYVEGTDHMPTTNQLVADPALTLLDATGEAVLAANDDEAPLQFESELVYRAAASGTVCLRVEHTSSWQGVSPQGDVLLTYDVLLSRYENLEGLYDGDREPNDDIAGAQVVEGIDLNEGTFSWEVIGTLDDQDEDVYRLEVPSGAEAIEVRFSRHGPGGAGIEGNGSTLALGSLELLDESGAILARAEGGATAIRFPNLPGGHDVLLRVRRAPGAAVGTNDFYRFRGRFEPSIAWLANAEAETEAGQNDQAENAELAADLAPPGGYAQGYVQYRVAGFIHATANADPVDQDHWGFTPVGGPLHLYCWSARSGSGVQNATFAVVDQTGHVVRSSVEPTDRDLVWGTEPGAEAPLLLPGYDLHYLRVTAEGQHEDVASRWYECVLRAFVP